MARTFWVVLYFDSTFGSGSVTKLRGSDGTVLGTFPVGAQ
jgi:hypothetical protein